MGPDTYLMNIITIVGARPQFIKAAPVSAALSSTGAVQERLLHTGQHFDDNMSDIFFRELGVPVPAWNLGLGGGTHGAMTGAQLAAIEQVLIAERPDAVLVYGDTNSTLAGALAAAKLHIPVAHVEAGLRSFNRRMPEEINRVLTDHLSHWLFAPTESAVLNLEREGLASRQVHRVGDVMYDAALHFAGLARSRALRHPVFAAIRGRPFVLATVHRAENTDTPDRLRLIVDALAALAGRIDVVWPMHPRTRKVLQQMGARLTMTASMHCVEPLGYLDMIEIEQAAQMIVTDSGGVQKEAFFFGKPCVTLRDETEWVELVEAGWNRLAPPVSVAALEAAIHAALGSVGAPIRPYGEGDAAQRIARTLLGSAD
jgi:UDP-GlcNAc3NAcA epimerase